MTSDRCDAALNGLMQPADAIDHTLVRQRE